MAANGSAFLRYTTIISVQKLAQVIESNIAGFLKIQRRNRKNAKENTQKTTEINWD